jgi:hypothetical protein
MNRQQIIRLQFGLDEIKKAIDNKPNPFKLPYFQPSIFLSMPSDLKQVSSFGRILDNSRCSFNPLTIFNSTNFTVFNYHEKLKTYN